MNGLRATGAALALSGAAWLSAIFSTPGDHTWRLLIASILIYGGCRLAFLGADR